MVVIIDLATQTVVDLLPDGSTINGLGAGLITVPCSAETVEEAQSQVLTLIAQHALSQQREARKLTRVEFIKRLTAQEWLAALDSMVPEMRHMMALIQAAEYIDLDDPTTQAGVQGAVALGVLTEPRALEVLA